MYIIWVCVYEFELARRKGVRPAGEQADDVEAGGGYAAERNGGDERGPSRVGSLLKYI